MRLECSHALIRPVCKFPPTENQPALQGGPKSGSQAQPAHGDSADNPDQPAKAQDGPLQPMSRLSLVRFIDGELVQVVRSIPAGKKGFHMKAGVPLNENALRMAVASAGSAINPGDHAQITNLDFKDKEIIVDVNGGGKGKTRLRDRIHLEVGGVPTMSTTPDTPVNTNAGATLYLDFDKPVPDMTADDLKQFLAGVLDFSKRHSAAVRMGGKLATRDSESNPGQTAVWWGWITIWCWRRWAGRIAKSAKRAPTGTKSKIGSTGRRLPRQFS